MTSLDDMADTLNRMVKLALDTGEAATVEDAMRIFTGYRLQIIVGADAAESAGLQAAAMTAVNCAARTFLGGVTVVGGTFPVRARWPRRGDFASLLGSLGGRHAACAVPDVPTLVLGNCEDQVDPLALRVTYDGWSGGVVQLSSGGRLAERGNFTPAGVLAGAVGVSEMFQRVRGGNVMACRRSAGLNLWRPEQDWRRGESGPLLDVLPSSAWLVGVGNLGQAYLWAMGLLPFGERAADIVMQDLDALAPSNLSTSLLTEKTLLGQRKTRAMAAWAERHGFQTRIVERSFAPDFRVGAREPAVALIGVDNALARQAIELVGFDRVIEAGLGKGPQDFLGIDLHTFPASKPASEVWRDTSGSDAEIAQPAYREMLEKTGDRCGVVRLAGRSIGAPFVGAVAAALVVAELLRLTMGAHRFEVISCHLRDLATRTIVRGDAWEAFNPGTMAIAA